MDIDISKIKGLIFDLDGTLADTMPLHLEAWNEVGKEYGISLTHEEHQYYAGMPTSKIVDLLAQREGLTIDSKEFADKKEQLFVDEKLTNVKPIKIVADFLYSFQDILPIAVGTGSQRKTAETIVKTLEVNNIIGALVSADDVKNHKPAPDTFLLCAEKISVNPKNCLVFEDAELGMQAAKSAGMQAINITDTSDRELKDLLTSLEILKK